MDKDTVLLALGALVALANLVALAAYAVDKRRAAGGGRRISERTLILLGVPGPLGAWVGVLGLRHKTRKPWFLARLVLASAVLPALAAAWLSGAFPGLR